MLLDSIAFLFPTWLFFYVNLFITSNGTKAFYHSKGGGVVKTHKRGLMYPFGFGLDQSLGIYHFTVLAQLPGL